MKAAVSQKPRQIQVGTVDNPTIVDPGDVIIKVIVTATYGSDLHILSRAVPQKDPLIMVHEFMGIVEEVGNQVNKLKNGDRAA